MAKSRTSTFWHFHRRMLRLALCICVRVYLEMALCGMFCVYVCAFIIFISSEWQPTIVRPPSTIRLPIETMQFEANGYSTLHTNTKSFDVMRWQTHETASARPSLGISVRNDRYKNTVRLCFGVRCRMSASTPHSLPSHVAVYRNVFVMSSIFLVFCV